MTQHPEHLEFVDNLPGWFGPLMLVLLMLGMPLFVTWRTFRQD